jgi:hypothetical protein
MTMVITYSVKSSRTPLCGVTAPAALRHFGEVYG